MAAGLGFKDFVTGEVLTAADVDGYLMQGIWVFDDAAARDAAVTSPQEGNACYLKDTNEVLTYSGSVWVAVGGSSSPLTTKGDLYTYSTTDARLAVGANDTVLTADSAEATGLKWAAPASGGGMTLLSTTATTSGGSVTISGISGSYKNLLVIGTGITGSNNTDSSFRFNSNTTSVYSAYNINYINTSLTGNVSNSTLISGSAVGTSTTYSDTTNFTMNIYRYSEASEFKNITIYSKSRSTVDVGRWTTASFGSDTAISSITYALDVGTLATGNIYIYGVS